MNEWWFVVGVMFGSALAWYFLHKEIAWLRQEVALQAKELDAEEELASGFTDFNQQLQQIKATRKLSLLDMLEDGKAQPSSVFAEHFGISNRTVLRYLNELEEEGKVTRTAKTGRTTKWQAKR